MSDKFVLGKSPIGQMGRKAERHAAKRMKGRETRASGNMDSDKGDIELPEFLVENKATEASSYSLKHEILAKIAREALEKGKQPALALQFCTGSGLPKQLGKWVIIPEALFDEIQAIYAERE